MSSFEDQKEKWSNFFDSNHLDDEKKDKYLNYITPLISNEVPIIFELFHLSKLINVSYKELVVVINSPEKFYREFTMPKRTGGVRTISSPYPMLALCQKWIYQNILKNHGVNSHSYAYVEGKTIVDNARVHLGKKNLLKIDLIDFFGSIKINRVKGIFKDLGYSNSLSYFLSALCCLDGKLPQGASTSPIISNIVASRLDKRLSFLARKMGVNYTRYADDLTFSGDNLSVNFVSIVKAIVESECFFINDKKTIFKRHGDKKVVAGICITGDKVRVTKSFRREFRKSMFFLRKNGVKEFNGENGSFDPLYIDRMIGKANFILSVEPDNKFAKDARDILINQIKKY